METQHFQVGVAAVTYGPDNKVTKFISSNVDYEMGDGSGTKVFYQGVTDETKNTEEEYLLRWNNSH